MPQFDLLTIGAQIFGLLLSFSFFYYYSLTKSLTSFIEIKKLRSKKIINNTRLVTKIDKDLKSNLWLTSHCYLKFIK